MILVKSCKQCGAILTRTPGSHESYDTWTQRIYCSRRCVGLSRRRWQTGRYRHVVVDGVQHYEHRYVMEQHLGRALRTDEQVHHLNRDKSDNRLENLQIITASAHGSLHRPLREFCMRGHRLSGDNVYVRLDTGHRQCRACRNLRRGKGGGSEREVGHWVSSNAKRGRGQ